MVYVLVLSLINSMVFISQIACRPPREVSLLSEHVSYRGLRLVTQRFYERLDLPNGDRIIRLNNLDLAEVLCFVNDKWVQYSIRVTTWPIARGKKTLNQTYSALPMAW
jgi:hypothetical protein